VAVDEGRVLGPEDSGIGHDRVAVGQRPAGRVRLRLERADHPGADQIDPAVAVHEAAGGGRIVLVAGRQVLVVQLLEQGDDAMGFRRRQLDVLGVGKNTASWVIR
jgi:hypothetical protein